MHYQCKNCKKIIAKSNPKAPVDGTRKISLIQTDTKRFGFYFAYPVGHCRACGEGYEIKAGDLTTPKKLSGTEKKALAKDIADSAKKIEADNVKRIEKDILAKAKKKEAALAQEEADVQLEEDQAAEEKLNADKDAAKADFEKAKKNLE